MSDDLHLRSPVLDFDPRLANELARLDAHEVEALASAADPPDAFNGYTRSLTTRGGLLFTYWDQAGDAFLDGLQWFAWCVATSLVGWLVVKSRLPGSLAFVLFLVAALLIGVIAFRKIKVWHSIEIHPDGMIVDGRYFSADMIGDHWPQLQMKHDDINRLILCGIYGTRFIEYATANRLDENDRGPEVLAEDLELAMEQMWGRREAIFAVPPGR
jgi:hypothetical protein